MAERTVNVSINVADLPTIKAAILAAYQKGRDDALEPFLRLFVGDPDTACRTTWRPDESMPECSAASVECVEVPMDDLRDAFDRARAIWAEARGTDTGSEEGRR